MIHQCPLTSGLILNKLNTKILQDKPLKYWLDSIVPRTA